MQVLRQAKQRPLSSIYGGGGEILEWLFYYFSSSKNGTC